MVNQSDGSKMDISLLGQRFVVDPSVGLEFWRTIAAGRWERHSFELLQRLITADDVVLDVGAWAGPLALFAASLGAEVHAIEPDPEVYGALVTNGGLNPQLRHPLRTYPLAIAPANGVQPLFARSAYGQSSTSLLHRVHDGVMSASCDAVTFTEFARQAGLERVDLLKIDIEGGEFQILGDLTRFIASHQVRSVYLSLHFGHLREAQHQRRWGDSVVARLLFRGCERLSLRHGRGWFARRVEELWPLVQRFNHLSDATGRVIDGKEALLRHFSAGGQELVMTEEPWAGAVLSSV